MKFKAILKVSTGEVGNEFVGFGSTSGSAINKARKAAVAEGYNAINSRGQVDVYKENQYTGEYVNWCGTYSAWIVRDLEAEHRQMEARSAKMRNAIEKSGFSQTEIAEKMGIKVQVLNRWVTGQVKPRPASLRQLAEICGVDYKDLL
jgi:ribosome-binding protein aMBF1 (putative translation factor)